MLERDARAAVARFERDVGFGVASVHEHEPLARLPDLDARHRAALARGAVVHLDQPAADERLEADADTARRVEEVVRAALVPGVDLVGEHLERGLGVDGDVDRHAYRRGGASSRSLRVSARRAP